MKVASRFGLKLRNCKKTVFYLLTVLVVTFYSAAMPVAIVFAANISGGSQKAIFTLGIPYYNLKVDNLCGTGTDGGSGALVGSDEAEKIWNYLKTRGLSDVAAAGVMGNIQQESQFKPIVEETSGGGGFGIIQWTGERRTELESAAAAAGVSFEPGADEDAALLFQLDYLWNELPWQDAVNAETSVAGDPSISFASDNTGNGSTLVFHAIVEKSGDDAGRKQIRIDNAVDILAKYGGSGGSTTGTGDSGETHGGSSGSFGDSNDTANSLSSGGGEVGSYGMPNGTQISYGQSDQFPEWVRNIEQQFNVQASTYPGHQESDRNEAGYAPNPELLNRGIDFAGSTEDLQKLAEWFMSIAPSTPALEQVIWQNPSTGQKLGWAGRNDVSGDDPYYNYPGGYDGHTDHVHLRASGAIGGSGIRTGVTGCDSVSSSTSGSIAQVAEQMGAWGEQYQACYVWGGGHGWTQAQMDEAIENHFSGSYGVDCSGFVAAVIYKATGYYGSWTTDSMCSDSANFKEVSESEAQPGDFAIECTTHVEVITAVGDSYATVGSQTEGCGAGMGASPGSYKGSKVLRYIGEGSGA